MAALARYSRAGDKILIQITFMTQHVINPSEGSEAALGMFEVRPFGCRGMLQQAVLPYCVLACFSLAQNKAASNI